MKEICFCHLYTHVKIFAFIRILPFGGWKIRGLPTYSLEYLRGRLSSMTEEHSPGMNHWGSIYYSCYYPDITPTLDELWKAYHSACVIPCTSFVCRNTIYSEQRVGDRATAFSAWLSPLLSLTKVHLQFYTLANQTIYFNMKRPKIIRIRNTRKALRSYLQIKKFEKHLSLIEYMGRKLKELPIAFPEE